MYIIFNKSLSHFAELWMTNNFNEVHDFYKILLPCGLMSQVKNDCIFNFFKEITSLNGQMFNDIIYLKIYGDTNTFAPIDFNSFCSLNTLEFVNQCNSPLINFRTRHITMITAKIPPNILRNISDIKGKNYLVAGIHGLRHKFKINTINLIDQNSIIKKNNFSF